jgi:hypothetical protein
MLSKSHPFMPFEQKADCIDFMAFLSFPYALNDQKKITDQMERDYGLPRTIKNAKKILGMNLKQYKKKSMRKNGVKSNDTDDEGELNVSLTLIGQLEMEKEEEERQAQKEVDAKKKREEEDAKNAGKEAFDAYKKKVEAERVLEEKAENKRQDELDDQDYQNDIAKEASYERVSIKLEQDDEEEDEDLIETMEYLDEHGNLKLEDLDENYRLDPEYILGEDKKKKHIIEGGLPVIRLERIKNDEDTLRFTVLYRKMKKLSIAPDEELELKTMLDTKKTNPAFFSKITGIPLEEIETSQEKSKSFVDNNFEENTDLTISEGELKLIEKEVQILSLQNSDSTITETNLQVDYYYPPIEDYTQPRSPYKQDIPIDFYDNKDGFWDDYKQAKLDTFDIKNITHRPFSRYSNILFEKNY